MAEDIIGNWQLTTAALKVRTVGKITTGRKGSPAAQGKAPCEETLRPSDETYQKEQSLMEHDHKTYESYNG